MNAGVSWKSAVSAVLERVPRDFELREVLRHKGDLASQFPANKHVDAKIRQTLQVLRDRGELEFLGAGRYRKTQATPRFSCLIDTTLAGKYRSSSQAARAMIEPWAAYHLYCLDCPSDDISALPNNTKVADMRCARCETSYQIKSREGRFGTSLLGGEYATYACAAREERFPHLVLVEWDRRFSSVFVVQAIPGNAVTSERIVARKRLSQSARRAGWQGCTIDTTGLPRVDLLTPSFRDPGDCRRFWSIIRA